MPHQETRAAAHTCAQPSRLFVEQHSSLVGDTRQSLSPLAVGDRRQLSIGLVRQRSRRKLGVPLGNGGNFSFENLGRQMVELDLDRLIELQIAAIGLVDQQHRLKTLVGRNAEQLRAGFDQAAQVLFVEGGAVPAVQLERVRRLLRLGGPGRGHDGAVDGRDNVELLQLAFIVFQLSCDGLQLLAGDFQSGRLLERPLLVDFDLSDAVLRAQLLILPLFVRIDQPQHELPARHFGAGPRQNLGDRPGHGRIHMDDLVRLDQERRIDIQGQRNRQGGRGDDGHDQQCNRDPRAAQWLAARCFNNACHADDQTADDTGHGTPGQGHTDTLQFVRFENSIQKQRNPK